MVLVQRGQRAWAETNRQMFARIAHRYDLVNTLMTFGRDAAWRRLAAAAVLPAGGLGLDMAAGTGALTFSMAERSSWVVGVDICWEMLALGQHKLDRLPSGRRVQFILADGLRLPFPDDTFDGAATAFALRNVADLGTVLAELYRVLKPGGRLACLELTRVDFSPLAALHRAYFSTVAPALGAWFTGDGDAYRYLARSQRRFLAAGDLQHRLQEIGFQQVRYCFYHFRSVAMHVGTKAEGDAGHLAAPDHRSD